MQTHSIKRFSGARACTLLAFMALGACGPSPGDLAKTKSTDLGNRRVVVPGREGMLRNFPCQECHDKIDSPDEAPSGKQHRDIRVDHFDGAENCSTCHDTHNRDKLILLNGSGTSFNAAHEVCGQCHSDKLKDWKIGAHGQQKGSWHGTAHRQSCTGCHDAHHPKLPSVQADAAPPFPKLGIPKEAHE